MQITHQTFQETKKLAALWQSEIDKGREASEQKFHEVMKRMLKNPINKIFLIELLDQSFRANGHKRVANQLEYIFSKYKNTDIFSDFEELLVWSFRHIGVYMPDLSVELFIKYLRNDVSKIVLKGEDEKLNKHLLKRRFEGTRVNINIIGEAVLGEEESSQRVEKYITALQNPNIDYISIKISTIFSQIVPLAHKWSVDEISNRLEKIYDEAIKNPFKNAQGKSEYKFVNLDMEEYKDVAMTMDAFMQTLSKQRFIALKAGIVLQAYLPESLRILKRVVAWAQERVKNGGAPIKVRLVKGANQEMELTEASLRGWPCVTYLHKSETDANYKLLIDYLMQKDVAPYVNVGIASHNLFDHALANLLAHQRGVSQYYSAEMLEGMSETAYKVLKKEGINVILYAPIATEQTFTNAIAYLVRRFDENTAQNNFLRHSFGLRLDSPAWEKLVKSYDEALSLLPSKVSLHPFRTQNRAMESFQTIKDVQEYSFEGESDTDFALEHNIKWAESIRDKWKNISESGGYDAYPVIGGRSIDVGDKISRIDKSQYPLQKVVGRYILANKAELQKAVAIAKEDPDGWRKLDIEKRQRILMNVANEFRKSRGDLIGIAAAEVGKVFSETDVEVSEAIDFLNFYPYSAKKIAELENIKCTPKGVGVVVSPWNFPIAIPTGGVAAALAAGNTVILKPSSDAILSAYMLCECFWKAGVGKNTLQFVPSSGENAGKALIQNKDVDFVIFTGGEHTALHMLKVRPDLHLSAETGGKDATIVTALADKDQAVKNVIGSAFNNSGQKCSATSLLVLEREVYEDENFKTMLIDAASSLNVGSVWEFQNKIGTLVNKPTGNLQRALEYLDKGEEWVLEPSYAHKNPYMLKPSIRYGTTQGDFCHMHELFGPVLSVMCAENLQDAIDMVNITGYGLTSGLESLDEREQEIFKTNMRAGNLYINRVTTGAIVLRQPFGGMGKSAIGSGKKAGGLNYVSQFMNLNTEQNVEHETSGENIAKLSADFSYWLSEFFQKEHDYFQIRGESNRSRYLSVKSVLFRFGADDSFVSMFLSVTAAKLVGAAVGISIAEGAESEAIKELELKKSFLLEQEDRFEYEDEKSFSLRLTEYQRIRYLDKTLVSSEVLDVVGANGLYIADEPFVAHGRIELMHYFIEQSISNSYHRYGNLGVHGLKNKEDG